MIAFADFCLRESWNAILDKGADEVYQLGISNSIMLRILEHPARISVEYN